MYSTSQVDAHDAYVFLVRHCSNDAKQILKAINTAGFYKKNGSLAVYNVRKSLNFRHERFAKALQEIKSRMPLLQ